LKSIFKFVVIVLSCTLEDSLG